MPADMDLFDIEFWENDLQSQAQDIMTMVVVPYLIDEEPFDDTENADDIIMNERTLGIVEQSSIGLEADIYIDVDYAEYRNKHNKRNPQTLGFLDRGEDKLYNSLEELIDYDRNLK